MRFLPLLFLATSVLLSAQSKTKPAHVHGAAKLNIAIENKAVTIQLESPADSIVGFEYTAKTAPDKAKQEGALNTLKTRIGEMVVFDPKSACKLTPGKVAVEKDPGEDHSDVNAEFKGTCSGSLTGTTLRFGFSRIFPRIVDLDVQLLNGDQQTGAKIHNDQGSIPLK
jgi:hypothetical protein